ncbi:aspartyl/glutamyl-tRNA amidotransferase subunit B [Ammoniphilus oxalaticus]|uniref:Aspartyl/glutamyl-tRNA(Asn/Gln) amidotransferase subunit B n=1 Tax=Ammoniphilus oxalaticus TaxID=66863 RepID=A0A419SDC0_9BACL|nr:Asp-tRNA(Asn)/Glu-tRNA(Gln) amidotransferase subunit GatB [Ammoniphilus oxalaticus]RKD21071.1 aspartyl/glutamyl-tRNA amidotransferase subunit B [Ammoniphilus oxalaticus]
MNYETVIGLEVHAELSTNTKIFCGCPTEFGAPPNTHTCPICLGHPGVLPLLNKRAVEFAIKASLALNCQIGEISKFDRKNYFYPDLPKAYQISQQDQPIGQNGWIDIVVNGETKRIRINRLHLEEDAGKLIHSDYDDATLADYNRSGVPLVEIVSEADLRSPEEARAYLEKVRSILQYCEVSDVRMEEGSLRCDANISLRPFGQAEFGTKAELKNMNSFRNVQRGLEYEQIRQAELLNKGELIVQETRRWDDANARTLSMRGKEEANDYRYFPDPDLVHLEISRDWVEEIKTTIPELPDARQARYVEDYGLSQTDAAILTSSKDISDFFQQSVETGADARQVSNWIMGDLMGYLNAEQIELKNIKMTPASFAEMIKLIEKGTISTKIAKTVFGEMLETGKAPEQIVEEKGLVQISDEGAIREAALEAISNHPQSVQDYKEGKTKAIGFLVGQVMRATKGKANPGMVNQLLKDELDKL